MVTAYRELRQVGSDDVAAFQACTTLYRIHHPEASISEARLAAKVGTVQQVIVDAIDGELAIARSMADAPEIDGLVQVQDGREAGLQPGDFALVRIMGNDEHDLYGEVEYDA